jgi:polyhydroxyalkanoate synthesis regulator phasin
VKIMPIGLTRASRDRAMAAAQSLAAEARQRVGTLTDEIWAASRANRDLLENLIAAEVERAAGRLGFARREDVVGLQASIDRLRAELEALGAERTSGSRPDADPGP